MRFIGLDVHLDFCEIAICEAGRVRSGGRVATTPEGLAILANSLGSDDQAALEATGNALAIARRLEPRVARVIVASRTELRAITEAKVKTDRRDARTLARLLAAGILGGCWLPDEQTRAPRRRLARRAQLVPQRTRAKNEVHAVLMRTLKGRPPLSDVFGRGGRVWLAELELPADERETVDGCLRQIDVLDAEIAILERGIAEHALRSDAIKRLMTVPGVSLMTATTFIAAVGDIRRLPEPRKLVSYLGLDPKVRQSGIGAARHGRISKQGAAQVRQMLAEAAFVAVSTPGPMRAFYERVRARRGNQIAIVAVAGKLAVLFWHVLTRGQDYAFQRPSLTRKSCGASSCAPAPSVTPVDETSRARTPTASACTASASANSPTKPRSHTAGSSPTGRRQTRQRRPPRLDFHPCSSSGASHRTPSPPDSAARPGIRASLSPAARRTRTTKPASRGLCATAS